MKKLITKLFLFSLSFSLMISINAKTDNTDNNIDYEKNSTASLQINRLRNDLKLQRSSYNKIYAGAWIDEDNNPNIAFIVKSVKKNIPPRTSNGVIYHYFKNSYAELEELQEKISASELFTNELISSSSIDDSLNQIVLEYNDKNEIPRIHNILSELNNNDIKIDFKESGEKAVNNSDYRGGATIIQGG